MDLSHRIVERLAGSAGMEIAGEREYVRNHVLQALLGWDRENDRLSADASKKISSRGKRVVEGSREWDLLFAEEMEKAYSALLARGE